MYTTFAASSNTATNGVALATANSAVNETDLRVYKLIVGTPVSAGNIWLYNISNPLGSSAANIAMKLTLPTFSTTNINPGVYVMDFGPYGLPLNEGGNLQIDQTMNVTVVWGIADNSQM